MYSVGFYKFPQASVGRTEESGFKPEPCQLVVAVVQAREDDDLNKGQVMEMERIRWIWNILWKQSLWGILGEEVGIELIERGLKDNSKVFDDQQVDVGPFIQARIGEKTLPWKKGE